MSEAAYELVAIGSGPAGQAAAIQAAKLGKRAAIVDREGALHRGALPSRTLQAAIVKATAVARRDPIAIDDLTWRTEQVLEQEQDAVAERLRRAGVTVVTGSASFEDAHTLSIAGGERRVTAERFVIAVGTTAARPSGFDFDNRAVLDCDGFHRLPDVPGLAGRRRRRHDRARVRVDGRGARLQRHADRQAPAGARVGRRADRRGARVPPARPRRRRAARRGGRGGRARARGRHHVAERRGGGSSPPR